MQRAPHSRRYAWIEEKLEARRDSFAQAVDDGLGAEPRSLPCRFFYDAVGSQLFAWLGSNSGNFPRADAHHFVSGIRDAMSADDRLLLGVDLRKDARTLERAYDDASGVTARFNKNLLARINRELGGAFDLADFTHRARVVDDGGRVEIGLVCRRSCDVRIAALGKSFRFASGDFIHTEDSTKYSERETAELAAAASLRVDARWLDRGQRFCVALL